MNNRKIKEYGLSKLANAFSPLGNEKKKDFINPTKFIIGVPGSGKSIHPWDGLKKCPNCGSLPWIVGMDGKDYHSGPPYKILCLKCKKATSSGSVSEINKEWNDICNNENSPVGNRKESLND
ncbi:MAG: hypothetical protein OSJ61_20010 [Lachnospiraceae bacterium]|nr:hypothetical protein [Lachnospiraceae bacterium]